MAKQMEKIHTRRIISLILLCVVICGFGAMRVFDYQVVNGKKYLASAQKSSYTTVKVAAARGEIVDRNGVPFTRNKAAFNLEFDYAFLKKGTENQTIFNLIKTFEALNEDWIDNLPISKILPYEFLPDRETDVKRLKAKLGMNTYATAQNCMDAIFEASAIKKYKTEKGKCTHCGKDFDECDYIPYSEEYNRKIAGVRYEMMAKEFSAYTPRYTFSEDVLPETIAIIKELSHDFIGVEVVEKAIRTYISGDVASHLIGTIGPMYADEVDYYKGLVGADYEQNDTVGKSGVEKAFESELRGKNGEMQVIKNSRGDVIDVIETIEPVAGKTIKLTVDFNFQKEVQQILADYIKKFNETNKLNKNVKAAAIAVLDTKTGGLLSSVSYPYYNIEDYYKSYSTVAKAEGDPQFNRALQGLYRPGSTFKPVVAVGGLEEGTITDQTKIYCDGFYHFFPPNRGKLPGCLQIGHRNVSLDVVSALKFSCNIFFYETGRLLGIEKIGQYAHSFGLGVETGLEIPNKIGVISSPEYSKKLGDSWWQGNVIQAAIGQLDTRVTPLQMAIEAMTLANHGTRYNAHILKNVLSYDQSKVLQQEKTTIASQFAMSDSTFDEISSGMIAAASTIGAPNQLTDLGYPVAIKSGSPQVSLTKNNNAFISFAPANNPEIAIACMVEDGNATTALVRSILLAYEKSKTDIPK
ncbi:MAG: penicillin-binding transpeptidase domain-containing protein [Oscillospiraceae bacterium]